VGLLAGYIANMEIAKRLKDEKLMGRRPRGVGITAWSPPRGVAGCNKYHTDGRLLRFFDIQLTALNFGTKHKTFIDAAKECDDEIKSTLKEYRSYKR
jgi:hypothetical protein